jgi:hypothetical protein
MNNFLFDLYQKLNTLGMDGQDLDYLLNALPWREKERKSDGSIIYECEIKTILKNKD